MQDVSLTGFGPGDQITIDYPGSTADPVTLTYGGAGDTAYTRENVEKAVETLTGENVTVGKWGYDPYAGIYSEPEVYPAPLGSPDEAGFQVMFAADPDPYTDASDRMNMHSLIVTTSAGTSTLSSPAAANGGGGPALITVQRPVPAANLHPAAPVLEGSYHLTVVSNGAANAQLTDPDYLQTDITSSSVFTVAPF